MPRNTAASNITNGVKSLSLQLRCHCIPDHNKFSYLSNKAVMVIFPNLCSWRHSFCLNLRDNAPEKPYQPPKHDPKWRLREWHVLTSFKKVFLDRRGFEGSENSQKLNALSSFCVFLEWNRGCVIFGELRNGSSLHAGFYGLILFFPVSSFSLILDSCV